MKQSDYIKNDFYKSKILCEKRYTSKSYKSSRQMKLNWLTQRSVIGEDNYIIMFYLNLNKEKKETIINI